jgi:signal transduction histidine kinase
MGVSRYRSALLGSATMMLLMAAWIAFVPDDWSYASSAIEFELVGLKALFVDTVLVVVPLLAGVECFRTARKSTNGQRAGWQLMGLACASWALGGAAWWYYEILADREVPFPSVADMGYLGLIPFAVAALLAFPQAGVRAALRLRNSLDGLIVAGSLLFMSWGFILAPAYEAGADSTLAMVIGLAYPVSDVLLATLALLALANATGRARVAWVLLATGLLGLAVADTAFAYLTAAGAYASGAWSDLGWLAAFLLIGLAALRPDSAVEPPQTPGVAPARVAVPLVSFSAALGAALALVHRDGGLSGFLFVVALVNVALIMIRQAVAVLDTRLLTVKVEAAYGQLKEMEASRSQMLHNIAHDLMSPLSPIQLHVHMLEHGEVGPTPQQAKAYAVIRRSADRIRRLVEDLRDLGRLEGGKLKLEPRPVDLRELAENVVETYRNEAKERQVTLELHGDGPLATVADPERIGQVLTNLVTNALKFTPVGGRVDVHAHGAADSHHVSVRDSGRGLTEEEIGRLFKPFSQVHDPSQVKDKGTGLGLFISKGIVEAHGGKIWVESQGLGHGSTFLVSLPVA